MTTTNASSPPLTCDLRPKPLAPHEWNAAPPILDTLLALCEPPGWDSSPPERAARRHATLNVVRLWTLVERLLASIDVGHPHTLRIVSRDAGAWSWDRWRHMGQVDRRSEIEVAIESNDAVLRFVIRVLDVPPLMRGLSLVCLGRPAEEADPVGLGRPDRRWHWGVAQGAVAVAYPQARALVAALVFSTRAQNIYVGPDPEIGTGRESA